MFIYILGFVCVDVFIYGEIGVGKEVVVCVLYVVSGVCGFFVVINCGVLFESVFELEIFGVEVGVYMGVSK